MALFPTKSLQLLGTGTDGSTNRQALLVLPGIGYGPSGMRAMRKFHASFAGLDLFVPNYIRKAGLSASMVAASHYIQEQRLERYDTVHVFCFIAGAYIFHDLMQSAPLQNAGYLMLDRSPYQERAPRIVTKRIPWIARALLGDFVFELASRNYPDFQVFRNQAPSIASPSLFIEEKPTSLMKLFSRESSRMGPVEWEARSMAEYTRDYCYVPYHHDSIYANFHRLMPAIRSQIETGHLGEVRRNPPA